MELRLVLQGATVKFEHHPMEVSSSADDDISVQVQLQLLVANTIVAVLAMVQVTTGCWPLDV